MAAHAFRWTGGVMVPLRPKNVAAEFADGSICWLGVERGRSARSHRHEFAFVERAWENLPDGQRERFASPEALRKWALIKTGWCDREERLFSSAKDANLAAAMIRAKRDDYSVIVVTGRVLTILTAKSQRVAVMGHDDFQKSKTDVLQFVAGLIGVSPDQLEQEALKGAA